MGSVCRLLIRKQDFKKLTAETESNGKGNMCNLTIGTQRFLYRSRESWAEKVNQELERKNVPQRVDHRSYNEQGIEQIPTQHIGVSANAMEKRGIESQREMKTEKSKKQTDKYRP